MVTFDLRRLAAGLAVCIVGGTGLLIVAVSSSSARGIISDCESAADSTLATCYDAGEAYTDNVSAVLMNSVVGDVRAAIKSYLAVAVAEVQTIAQYLSLFHPSVSDNWAWVNTTLRPYLAAAMEIDASKGIVSLGVYGGGGLGGGLPPGRSKHMILFTSADAIVEHGDSSYFQKIQDWMDLGENGSMHFIVIQYEGLYASASDCSSVSPVRAALGPTDEKGFIETSKCFGKRIGHHGGDSNAPSGGCEDSLANSPLCRWGKLCSCAELISQHPCHTKPVMKVGWKDAEVDVDQYCMRSCDACGSLLDGTCFHSPDNRWQATWAVIGTAVRFTVRAEVDQGGWAGIGFSCDGNMPGSDVVMATLAAGVSDRFASGYREPELDKTSELSETAVEYSNGVLTFHFTRPLQPADSTDSDLTVPQHILWAYGPMDDEDPQKMGYHTSRSWSQTPVSITDAAACGTVQSGATTQTWGVPQSAAGKADPLADCRFIPGSRMLDGGEQLIGKALSYPPQEVRWTPLTTAGPYLVLGAFSAWGDPDDAGRRVGAVRASVDVRAISLLMAQITRTLGDGARIYATQTDPWTGKMAGFAGASHGSVISGGSGSHYREAKPVLPGSPESLQDPVISEHAQDTERTLPGGIHALTQQTRVSTWTPAAPTALRTAPPEPYYQRATHINNVEVSDSDLGLDLVVLLPVRSLSGGIHRAAKEARKQIAAAADHEEQQRRSAFKTMCVLLAGAVMLIAAGGSAVAYCITPSLQVDSSGAASHQLHHAAGSPQGQFQDGDEIPLDVIRRSGDVDN
eukprot:TRINITY_DN9288_c0_g1_i1.p1 TRINITY_DN9288_c0_g1~~TRINITY_DN9288_c0_g1_i1.p1  ORF type:complete len:797 (+),score=202.44 TRINITY_DN9288_c0_g1_i1:101-2491(+)